MSVRDGRPHDALAIARVHVRSWQSAYRGIFDDAFLDSLRAEDRVGRYSLKGASRSGPQTIVAERGGEIVGFTTVGPSRDADAADAAELYAVYVDPVAWGSGVGRQLMGAAYARIEALGFERAILWVLEGNERARHFYRSDGWQPDGARREEDVWDVPAVVVRYVSSLR